MININLKNSSYFSNIETSAYVCGICTLEEYKEALSYGNKEPIVIISDEVISIDLSLEFPFAIPETSMLRIQVMTDYLKTFHDVYFGNIPDNKTIKVSIPKPLKYPEGYWWKFHLIVPDKLAMCLWGLEEIMIFMDEKYSRTWKIKFLEYYRYRNGGTDDTGGSRYGTIIEPVN